MVEDGRGASAGTEGECRGSALVLVLCGEEDSHRGGVTAANIERSKVVTSCGARTGIIVYHTAAVP